MTRKYEFDAEAVGLAWSRGSQEEDNQEDGTTADIFARYRPPFDLTSDMLFAFALCQTAPLRDAFPEIPFLSLPGKTPLVIWFSRVKKICYHDSRGVRRCIDGKETGVYNELNVVVLLRQRAFFVSGIYATSDLTIRVGHGYGMPKQPTMMNVQGEQKWFCSSMKDGTQQSFVRARLLGAGKLLGGVASHFWPRRIWPARFPSGSAVRPLLQATPWVQIVYVRRGQLALEATWLPKAVALLPIGFYLPDLRMQLPPP
ncbi:MAG: hypothetical protein ACJ795_17130 [Ktedonobacteraceae bacterium]